MLDDAHAAGGHNEHGCGGDIKEAKLVAPGATEVEESIPGDGGPEGAQQEHPDEPGDLAGSLALEVKSSQKSGTGGNRLLFIEEAFAGGGDVGLGKVLSGGEFFSESGEHGKEDGGVGTKRKTGQARARRAENSGALHCPSTRGL